VKVPLFPATIQQNVPRNQYGFRSQFSCLNLACYWHAGVLVVLDARPDGIIYRDLIPEYVNVARTIYEGLSFIYLVSFRLQNSNFNSSCCLTSIVGLGRWFGRSCGWCQLLECWRHSSWLSDLRMLKSCSRQPSLALLYNTARYTIRCSHSHHSSFSNNIIRSSCCPAITCSLLFIFFWFRYRFYLNVTKFLSL
jgi:hypothetical protein